MGEIMCDCHDDNYFDYFYGWVRLCGIVMMTIIMIIFMDGSDCQDDNYYNHYYGWVRIHLIVMMTIIIIIIMDG